MVAERGRFEEDGVRVRKDGSRFWANMHCIFVLWSNGPCISKEDGISSQQHLLFILSTTTND